jgi:hypothetical protein
MPPLAFFILTLVIMLLTLCVYVRACCVRACCVYGGGGERVCACVLCVCVRRESEVILF